MIGDFHLMGADEKRIDATTEALCELDPAIICPGHCTGLKAVCQLEEALGERCRPLAVGDSIML